MHDIPVHDFHFQIGPAPNDRLWLSARIVAGSKTEAVQKLNARLASMLDPTLLAITIYFDQNGDYVAINMNPPITEADIDEHHQLA